MYTFAGHPEGIHQLIFSPDGTRVLTGGMATFLGVWEVAKSDLMFELHRRLWQNEGLGILDIFTVKDK